MYWHFKAELTLHPAAPAFVRGHTPVPEHLISEAHRSSAPLSVTLQRAGLQIDGGRAGPIGPETEHPTRPMSVSEQQLQSAAAFYEEAGTAEGWGRFDADGGGDGGGEVRFQDHP